MRLREKSTVKKHHKKHNIKTTRRKIYREPCVKIESTNLDESVEEFLDGLTEDLSQTIEILESNDS